MLGSLRIALAAVVGARAATDVSLELTPATPWARHTIDNTSKGADGVKFADVNGDGRPDIATGWEEGGSVRIYLHPGHAAAKQPWPKVVVGNVDSPEDAVLVDLDGDGTTEVVSATEGRNRTLYVHRASQPDLRGNWTTTAFPATQGKQPWMFILPLDVDRQNGIDLVVGSKTPDPQLGWLRSPKDPRDLTGWTFHPFRAATWIMSILPADINRDGFTDILFSDRRGPTAGIFWLENPGPARDASSAWKEHRIAAATTEDPVMFITHADVDGDGRREVVAAYQKWGVAILSETSGGTWSMTRLKLRGAMGSPKAVSVGDINGDGRADLVMTCEEATGTKTGVVWIEQTAAGWRLRDLGGPAGIKYDLVPLLDIDGDGDLDAITCEERDQLGVVWYENPFGRSGAH